MDDKDGAGEFLVLRPGGKPFAYVFYDPPRRGRSRAEAWRIAYAVAAGKRGPGPFRELPRWVSNPRPVPEFVLDVDAPPGKGGLRHPDGRAVTLAEFESLTGAGKGAP